jgi:uncharacterized membrane protein YraQ (UPF0718 family)
MVDLKEKLDGGMILSLLGAALYVALGLWDLPLAQRALTAFGRLAIQILPVLLLVFALMFLSNLLLGQDRVVRLLGHGAGLGGWVFAVAGGILSSGPIYMWYPLLSDLRGQGMSERFIAAFLYNRAVKIPLIPMMAFYFSWSFTLVLSVYMVLLSVANGVVVERLARGNRE